VTIGGQTLKRNYITHGEIMSGGKLMFYMSEKPKI
jgi:putative alpha-1,2-mannosidase